MLLAQFLAPLVGTTVPAAIVAGLVFGIFYNGRLNLPTSIIYHKLWAGWGFLFFLFLFRLGSSTANFAGWLGIAALWGIYCFFVWVGDSIADRYKLYKIHKAREKLK